MSKQLLLGDEAIAQAALDAGLSGVYAYPGTPSTEITEYIQMAPLCGYTLICLAISSYFSLMMKNCTDWRALFTTWSSTKLQMYRVT